MRKAKCRKQKSKNSSTLPGRHISHKFYTDFTYRSKLQLKTSIIGSKMKLMNFVLLFLSELLLRKKRVNHVVEFYTLQLSIFKDQESQSSSMISLFITNYSYFSGYTGFDLGLFFKLYIT